MSAPSVCCAICAQPVTGHYGTSLGAVVHLELMGCVEALTQRAEAAEALNVRYEEIYNNSSAGWIELRKTFGIKGDEAVVPTLIAKFKQQGAERDALRKVDDAMVERAAKAMYEDSTGLDWDERSNDMGKICCDSARLALDAALAVQP
jgi:hypothetical protein